MSKCKAVVAAVAVMIGSVAAQAQQDVPLISREVLFGNPDRAGVQISPDGSHLSFLAPVDGVLNVWVGPADDPGAAKPVTNDRFRGIRSYFWAYSNSEILYLQDEGGDEDWKVYSTNIESGETRNLTPFDSIPDPATGEPRIDPNTGRTLRPTARIQDVSHRFPGDILIGLNNRDPRWHDIYKVD
ncbi:MAG: hypothetical protein AAFX05_04775, partial [Planctomycetota bacterium]